MKKYTFPKGLRISSLRERKEFYEKEFNEKKAKSWLNFVNRDVVVLDLGSDSGIYKKGTRPRDKKSMLYFEKKKIKQELRKKLLSYLPEDAYYDRNIYDTKGKIISQELIFDLDPENIECENCANYKNIYSFCPDCFNEVKRQTAKLYKELSKKFRRLKIVYSGRGFHIHVIDKKAYIMSFKERKKLTKSLLKKGYAIDEWVSEGNIDLVRLPYSLHGLVSRIVTPLTLAQLKNITLESHKINPEFLNKNENRNKK